MKILLILLSWAILLLLFWPIVWLLSIPFRIVGAIMEGFLAMLKALLLLPARLLGYKANA